MSSENSKIITQQSLKAYFHQQISAAAEHQAIEAQDYTLFYLVNLLSEFSHAETLFETNQDGTMLKPLALIFADAQAAPTWQLKYQQLRRLGDVALFIAGVLPHSLAKKLVDIDYYIGMGANAYASLVQIAQESKRLEALKIIHYELASNFQAFVDLLGEVSEQANFNSDQNLLHLYEIWIKTGSHRVKAQLANAGIDPIPAKLNLH